MNIDQVKTAFKIADVELIKGETRLNFNYLEQVFDENKKLLPTTILTKNVARVYLIVVNKIITKIGSSQSEGGIKNTLNIYRDGGILGRPSIRSFGIWYFLYNTILKGNKIEFYMIYQEDFKKDVKGLFKVYTIDDANISCKILENLCLTDYLSVEKVYPLWNIQEKGYDWPDDVKKEHSEITNRSLSRKTTRKKATM
jgi:hypothetical protein